jgi:hypothetical protein
MLKNLGFLLILFGLFLQTEAQAEDTRAAVTKSITIRIRDHGRGFEPETFHQLHKKVVEYYADLFRTRRCTNFHIKHQYPKDTYLIPIDIDFSADCPCDCDNELVSVESRGTAQEIVLQLMKAPGREKVSSIHATTFGWSRNPERNK